MYDIVSWYHNNKDNIMYDIVYIINTKPWYQI